MTLLAGVLCDLFTCIMHTCLELHDRQSDCPQGCQVLQIMHVSNSSFNVGNILLAPSSALTGTMHSRLQTQDYKLKAAHVKTQVVLTCKQAEKTTQ